MAIHRRHEKFDHLTVCGMGVSGRVRIKGMWEGATCRMCLKAEQRWRVKK